MDELGEELLRFMDFKKIHRFHLIGNSMGGGISLYLSLYHPERIKKVVLVDPATCPDEGWRIKAIVGCGMFRSLVTKIIGVWTVRVALYDIYSDPSKVTEEMVAEYGMPLKRMEYRDTIERLIAGYFSRPLYRMKSQYTNMQVPSLIIWGENDRWIKRSKTAKQLNLDLKGSKLMIIKDAGHMPHQEQYVIFNRRVILFLK